MALIKCKECGGMVSDKATTCPHCGCPTEYSHPQTTECSESEQGILEKDNECSNVDNHRGDNNEKVMEVPHHEETFAEPIEQDSPSIHTHHNRIIWIILAIVLLLGGGMYLLSTKNTSNQGLGATMVDSVQDVKEDSVQDHVKDELPLTSEEESERVIEEIARLLHDGDRIYSFSEGIAKVERSYSRGNRNVGYAKYDVIGFVNCNGEVIVPWDIEQYGSYDASSAFHEGLAAVKRNNKWGYINTKGEEVIPLIYDYAESFSDGLAKFGIYGGEGRVGYINSKGKEVIIRNGNSGSFHEGLASVSQDVFAWGFINTKGEEIVPCDYYKVEDFSNGFAKVCKFNNGYGFVNTKGEEVVPCKYNQAWNFSDGFAAVVDGIKYGFVNTQGEEVVPCAYKNFLSGFSEGLAAMSSFEHGCGYVNTKGEEVIPFIYDYAFGFSEGLASVNQNGQWGYINTKGEEVIPLIYERADNFSEGLAVVKQNGRWGYINKQGNVMIPCRYDSACGFSNGLAKVLCNNRWGLINKNGEEVFPCRFDKIEDFNDGFAVVVYSPTNGNGGYVYYGLIDKYGHCTFDY